MYFKTFVTTKEPLIIYKGLLNQNQKVIALKIWQIIFKKYNIEESLTK